MKTLPNNSSRSASQNIHTAGYSISNLRAVWRKIQGEVGAYWLDRLVSRLQVQHKQSLIITGRVLAVLKNSHLDFPLEIPGLNIVTNDGDLFYAYRATDTQPTTDLFTDGAVKAFDGIMELYNGASGAPAKGNNRSNLAGLVTGSAKAMDSTYPKRNDSDPDNTGSGTDIVTYLVSYLTSEANATGIADVVITNPSPGASEKLLMHAEFATPFEKTSSDTLKVFVNHEMSGV